MAEEVTIDTPASYYNFVQNIAVEAVDKVLQSEEIDTSSKVEARKHTEDINAIVASRVTVSGLFGPLGLARTTDDPRCETLGRVFDVRKRSRAGRRSYPSRDAEETFEMSGNSMDEKMKRELARLLYDDVKDETYELLKEEL